MKLTEKSPTAGLILPLLMKLTEKSPTSSLILPLLMKLTEHFKARATDSTFVKSLKNAVGSNLSTRYTDPSIRHFLEEASALDPRTKCKVCVDEETWDRIEDKMTILDDTEIAVKITHTGNVSGDSSSLPALPNLNAVDKDINANEKVIMI
jgi:hypothetical protein